MGLVRISPRKRKKLIKAGASLLVLIILSLILGKNPDTSHVQSAVTQKLPVGFYAVAEFHDGDTISVFMNGKKEKVRLIGVDTPETKDPRKPVQCFGQAASDYTKTLIGTQPVRLEADSQSTNRDRYDRLLRYVYLADGNFVNKKLIEEGYGHAYTYFPFDKIDEFRVAEKSARELSKGLWAACPT